MSRFYAIPESARASHHRLYLGLDVVSRKQSIQQGAPGMPEDFADKNLTSLDLSRKQLTELPPRYGTWLT